MQLKADLHCHSIFSDGVLEPEVLAQRAFDNGVELWSLTDHDEVAGNARARQAATNLGMRFIAGIEVSVTWGGKTVHIVGLNIDDNNKNLISHLEKVHQDRTMRGQEMAIKLEKFGLANAFEGALKYVGNPDLLSRTHFARYMVEVGFCKHMQDAFDRYLADGKPAYVHGNWASLEQALSWIHEANGVAVVAHPGRYKYSGKEFNLLFDTFKSLGGQAIEVVTGSHTPEQYHEYANVARKYNFLASAGSDFHGPTESRLDLGKIPQLPMGLTPVWSLFS